VAAATLSGAARRGSGRAGLGPGRDGGYVVELERFEGPLDLLLHLIRQQDIDVFDIPIALITAQFLEAIRGIRPGELDQAGEFLEMAATLIRIKAQLLLPRPESDDDEDPRAELVRRLLEYEQIREIAARLERAEAERARRRGKGYVPTRARRTAEDTPLETTWDEVFEAALGVRVPDPLRSTHRVTPRTVSMDAKVTLILERLSGVTGIRFHELIAPGEDRMHGVMTLLAGLELTRRRTIRLRQSAPFHELWLYLRGEGEGQGDAQGGDEGGEGVEAIPAPVDGDANDGADAAVHA
jgi:segregation and condensation protein A